MRNLLSLSLIALAMLSISATARAEATEHATSCSYCTSAYQFGVYGVAALEAKQASKPFYLRHSIKPVTVHNPSTQRSARVTVNLATTTITLGALSIGVPNLGRVGFVLDFSDGSGSLTSTVDLSVIDRTIQAHNPVVVDCLKSKCSNYRKAFGSAGAPAPRRGNEEKEQQNAERARLSREISTRGFRPTGAELAFLTGRATSYSFGRNSRYRPIRCYTVYDRYGSTTRCPRAR